MVYQKIEKANIGAITACYRKTSPISCSKIELYIAHYKHAKHVKAVTKNCNKLNNTILGTTWEWW